MDGRAGHVRLVGEIEPVGVGAEPRSELVAEEPLGQGSLRLFTFLQPQPQGGGHVVTQIGMGRGQEHLGSRLGRGKRRRHGPRAAAYHHHVDLVGHRDVPGRLVHRRHSAGRHRRPQQHGQHGQHTTGPSLRRCLHRLSLRQLGSQLRFIRIENARGLRDERHADPLWSCAKRLEKEKAACRPAYSTMGLGFGATVTRTRNIRKVRGELYGFAASGVASIEKAANPASKRPKTAVERGSLTGTNPMVYGAGLRQSRALARMGGVEVFPGMRS